MLALVTLVLGLVLGFICGFAVVAWLVGTDPQWAKRLAESLEHQSNVSKD